jgi:hypothetical protein
VNEQELSANLDPGALAQPEGPKNPHASFLGIPAELRLAIYDYVFGSSLVHVHCHEDKENVQEPIHFSWTACREPNPKCTLLCANPKWSGLCKDSERCTVTVGALPEPRGFEALMWTCKSIRQESQTSFLRNTTVSIGTWYYWKWIKYLEERSPQHFELVRYITLAGESTYKQLVWDTDIPENPFESIRVKFPNLQGIAFQVQAGRYGIRGLKVEKQPTWRELGLAQGLDLFDRNLTVAQEVSVYQKPWWLNGSIITDIYARIRVIREGKYDVHDRSTSGWDDQDIETESCMMSGEQVTVRGKNAKWKRWWPKSEAQLFKSLFRA